VIGARPGCPGDFLVAFRDRYHHSGLRDGALPVSIPAKLAAACGVAAEMDCEVIATAKFACKGHLTAKAGTDRYQPQAYGGYDCAPPKPRRGQGRPRPARGRTTPASPL